MNYKTVSSVLTRILCFHTKQRNIIISLSQEEQIKDCSSSFSPGRQEKIQPLPYLLEMLTLERDILKIKSLINENKWQQMAFGS